RPHHWPFSGSLTKPRAVHVTQVRPVEALLRCSRPGLAFPEPPTPSDPRSTASDDTSEQLPMPPSTPGSFHGLSKFGRRGQATVRTFSFTDCLILWHHEASGRCASQCGKFLARQAP